MLNLNIGLHFKAAFFFIVLLKRLKQNQLKTGTFRMNRLLLVNQYIVNANQVHESHYAGFAVEKLSLATTCWVPINSNVHYIAFWLVSVPVI